MSMLHFHVELQSRFEWLLSTPFAFTYDCDLERVTIPCVETEGAWVTCVVEVGGAGVIDTTDGGGGGAVGALSPCTRIILSELVEGGSAMCTLWKITNMLLWCAFEQRI